MDIFDALHRAHFDRLFSLDEESREAKSKLLREAGVPEELIEQFCRPGVQVGMTFGGAKPVDVMNVVERVLFGQNAGSVLLRVSRPPYDEAGHVEISVIEIGPPAEQQPEGGQAGRQDEPGT